jgi:23S rRNA pseudouridine2605 synthase
MVVDHRGERSRSAGRGQAGPGAGERVAKALARAGVASRRDVERYIAEGRVSLNGQVLDSPAVKVGAGDVLMVDGKVVDDAEPTRLWRYHKPVGLVTTHKDPHERPTVFSYLPAGMPRVISVGRLDLNSEGLLLLTNDGGLARSLELPSSGWVRRYRARARGRITQEKLDRLQNGITIEGVNYGPIDAKLDKAKEGPQGANLWITVGLTEGKNREVRRVLEHLGLTVNRLIRLAYGPFSLGPLASGEVEEVGPRVIRELLAGHIAPEAMPSRRPHALASAPQHRAPTQPTAGRGSRGFGLSGGGERARALRIEVTRSARRAPAGADWSQAVGARLRSLPRAEQPPRRRRRWSTSPGGRSRSPSLGLPRNPARRPRPAQAARPSPQAGRRGPGPRPGADRGRTPGLQPDQSRGPARNRGVRRNARTRPSGPPPGGRHRYRRTPRRPCPSSARPASGCR